MSAAALELARRLRSLVARQKSLRANALKGAVAREVGQRDGAKVSHDTNEATEHWLEHSLRVLFVQVQKGREEGQELDVSFFDVHKVAS